VGRFALNARVVFAKSHIARAAPIISDGRSRLVDRAVVLDGHLLGLK